ncbi:MAG: ATP-binding protein [Pseudomonadota bacterium]
MNIPHDPATVTVELLTDALEALSEGIAIYDKDERLVICNSRYKELLGPIQQMIEPGMQWRDLIQSCVEKGMVTDRDERGRDWVETSEEQRGQYMRETEIRQTDGRTFHISYHPTKTGGFVVTRSDITERRKAEDRAAEREALLTTILGTNPTPVIMARLDDGRVIYRSPAAHSMFGHTEFGRDYFVDPEAPDDYVAKLKVTGHIHDETYRVRASDGSERTVSVSGGLTEYNGEPHVVSSVTDLTEQLERDALIRKVVESYPAPVMMNRPGTGEILYKSGGIDKILGKHASTKEFYVDLADRDEFLSRLYAVGELHDYRLRHYNAEGVPTWFAVSARLIKMNGEDVLVSHIRDLTTQLEIEAELDTQRQQIFQNEKMSALGGLLAGVAHELNNPLSVVVGHALMLQDETNDPNVKRQISKISTAAERCAKIVKTFLTMARQEPAAMDLTSINDVIRTAAEVAKFGEAASAVTIETDLTPSLKPVSIDADQITQVVINLILNAEQAIQSSNQGDRVLIQTEAAGDGVRITVEDNGPGVPVDIRGRVFDPFFTTKGVGEGTGIGLAVCHRIVAAHNGKITVDDAKGGGARFRITLPEAAPMAAAPEAPAAPETAKAARVLVIDDERDVADLNAEVLTRGGFEVEVIYDAKQALDILKDDRFDAIISDLNMPGVDGRGLHDTLRQNFPEMLNHIGYITGDTLGSSSQGFLKESGRPYLEKPVSPKELRAFVSQLCTEAST